MKKLFLIQLIISIGLFAQTTEVIKKTDIYFRLKRLVDEKHMGNLFKFMLIKNRNNKFKLGF